MTQAEYADWITERLTTDPDLSAAVFAISEFYRTLNTCVAQGRCRETSVVEAFEPYAVIYYNVFYLALRHADCTLGFPDTEAATARIAGLDFAPPDQCSGGLDAFSAS